MMKPIARFVRRDSDDPNDGLLLGSMMKSGDDVFLRGHVYEIVEIAGELVIKDMGESCIPKDMTKQDIPATYGCWGNAAGDLLNMVGRALVWTKDEMMRHLKGEKKK